LQNDNVFRDQQKSQNKIKPEAAFAFFAPYSFTEMAIKQQIPVLKIDSFDKNSKR